MHSVPLPGPDAGLKQLPAALRSLRSLHGSGRPRPQDPDMHGVATDPPEEPFGVLGLKVNAAVRFNVRVTGVKRAAALEEQGKWHRGALPCPVLIRRTPVGAVPTVRIDCAVRNHRREMALPTGREVRDRPEDRPSAHDGDFVRWQGHHDPLAGRRRVRRRCLSLSVRVHTHLPTSLHRLRIADKRRLRDRSDFLDERREVLDGCRVDVVAQKDAVPPRSDSGSRQRRSTCPACWPLSNPPGPLSTERPGNPSPGERCRPSRCVRRTAACRDGGLVRTRR